MKNISIISIPVTDQQRAKEFYIKAGFTLLLENSLGNGQTWVQLGFPGAETSITLVNWFEQMPPGCIRGLVVETEDIEKEIERLKENGIIAAPIEKMPWGLFASVTDPDGNSFTLHQV